MSFPYESDLGCHDHRDALAVAAGGVGVGAEQGQLVRVPRYDHKMDGLTTFNASHTDATFGTFAGRKQLCEAATASDRRREGTTTGLAVWAVRACDDRALGLLGHRR